MGLFVLGLFFVTFALRHSYHVKIYSQICPKRD